METIEKDIERARSLVKLSNLRYTKIKIFDMKKEAPLIIESYYEICKELLTAILFTQGLKTLSHKELVDYSKNYLTTEEFEILDQLRKKRNKIVYYGVFIDEFYIQSNRDKFEKIIEKLKDENEKSFN